MVGRHHSRLWLDLDSDRRCGKDRSRSHSPIHHPLPDLISKGICAAH